MKTIEQIESFIYTACIITVCIAFPPATIAFLVYNKIANDNIFKLGGSRWNE